MDQDVRQPVPGPQSPHLSMASSIERLEESAERMSMGSDITGEIRRIWAEQKQRDSPGPTGRKSSSSVSRSIIDTNITARRGGFSSSGYIPSPQQSFRSSNSDTGLSRQDTTSDSPNVQFNEHSGEGLPTEMDHNTAFTPPTPTSTSDVPAPLNPRRRRLSPSQSVPRPQLSPVSEIGRHTSSSSTSSRRYHNYQHTSTQRADRQRRPTAGNDVTRPMLAAPVPQQDVDRSASSASKSTLHHAASLFRDFDGIHYSPVAGGPMDGYIPYHVMAEGEDDYKDDDEDDEIDNVKSKGGPKYAELSQLDDLELEQYSTSNHPMHEQSQTAADTNAVHINFDNEEDPQIHESLHILPAAQAHLRWAEPPPSENMVYYPAPVPTRLNLPKRISQQPSHTINAMRRSKLLGSMPPGAWQSVLSLNTAGEPKDISRNADEGAALDNNDEQRHQRQSVLNFTKLPPQLRASVFFDHESVPHQIEVKDGSAVATLDRLLDASACAPADHSLQDLDLSGGPSSKGHKRVKSGALASLFDPKSDANKSRMSLLPFKKFSSSKTAHFKQDGAVKDDYPIDSDNEAYQTCGDELDGIQQHDRTDDNVHGDENNTAHEEGEHKAKSGMPSLEEQYMATPNTLLAELQSRKQQLRSRNRTAATSFPNGMHSTLLELDAVEQIEKRRRRAQKTSLAWEDPTAATARRNIRDDEDVPLAVLFPTKHGLANKAGGNDWDRPLGLFEKKHLEESEPLSKRRNRLMGFDPTKITNSQLQQYIIADDEPQSEHEDETLAQRTRRLKSTKALNDAIGNPNSDAFASDVISQFGGLDQTKLANPTTNSKEAEVPENETLGQRRRRLQAQATDHAQTRPQLQKLQTSTSLVNILAAAPVNTVRQVSNESKAQALAQPQNQISGYFDPRAAAQSSQAQPQLLHQTKSFTASRFNDGSGGIRASAMPTMSKHPSSSSLAPNAMMSGYPQQSLPRQSTMNAYGQMPIAYPQHQYLQYNIPMPQPMMQNQYPMPQMAMQTPQQAYDELMMTTKQRENIDRWRQSVMPS